MYQTISYFCTLKRSVMMTRRLIVILLKLEIYETKPHILEKSFVQFSSRLFVLRIFRLNKLTLPTEYEMI